MESNHQQGAKSSKPRSSSPWDERPYAWQSSEALDRITQSPHTTQAARNKLVYCALTWISSSKQFKGSSIIKVSKGLIAHLAGVSIRTVFNALLELEKAGVIHIEENVKINNDGKKEQEASTYTLVSFKRRQSGNNCHTPSGNDCHTPMANQEAPDLPTVLCKEHIPSGPAGAGEGICSVSTENLRNPKSHGRLDGSGDLDLSVKNEEDKW